MKIRRRNMRLLVGGGIVVVGLTLILALFVGVGIARAVAVGGWPEPGNYCSTDPLGYCCSGTEESYSCWGAGIKAYYGCRMVSCHMVCPVAVCALTTLSAQVSSENNFVASCYPSCSCIEPTGGSTWLADVCEPNDGFSADGGMTLDSGFHGALRVGASMAGPWYEVEVNGPPWVVTEEMMESFAAMVGVTDWHDMWVRAGEGYPQHVGNLVSERDARMDDLCQ